MNKTIKSSNSGSSTVNELLDLSSSYVHGLAGCLAIIFVLGLILNTISVAMIVKTKKMKPINILILNLAIADIIYTLG